MLGRLEVVVGGMYSGKTEVLLDRLVRAQIAQKRVILFKHSIDGRYSDVEVVSHRGFSLPAVPISLSEEIFAHSDGAEVLGVDEIQFFDPGLPAVLDRAANLGARVIAAGLDMDFMNAPFPVTQQLTSRADRIDKLMAVCNGCRHENATRSQLLRDGVPVTRAESAILVGGTELYEARCRDCFVCEENR